MNILRLPAHPHRLLVLTCLAAASLAGCGSDSADKKPAEPPGAASSAPASAPKSGGEAGSLAVPAGGPETIEDFPIPRGAKIIDLGPAGNMSWQFGIGSPGAATVVAFYKKALADEGYTVKENVKLTDNPNNIVYDLAFFGKAYGVVDEADLIGGTQVSVNDRPIDGLEP